MSNMQHRSRQGLFTRLWVHVEGDAAEGAGAVLERRCPWPAAEYAAGCHILSLIHI